MGKAQTSEKIFLPGVRLSFPNLDKATKFNEANDKEQAKFRAAFLLDPSNEKHVPVIAKIKSESARIAKLEFDGEIPKGLDRNWGTDADMDKVYEGYAGMFFIKANSAAPVPVVGRSKTVMKDGKPAFPLLKSDDKEWPYAGCVVNATITLWCQNSHGRKAINGNLIGVQFVEPGQPFGNKSADPNEEFAGYEDATGGVDPFGGDSFD